MLKKTLIGVVLAHYRGVGRRKCPGITQQTATIKRTPLLQENCGKLAAQLLSGTRCALGLFHDNPPA